MPISTYLQGKVALVTGASRNIGAATAKLLAAHGAKVAVNYLTSGDHAAQVVAAIKADGGEAIAYRADVTDRAQVEQMVREITNRWGRIDILVNNARPMPMSRETYLEMTPDLLAARVIAELRSVDNTCRSVFPFMKEQGWGRIINVTSIAGRRAAANRVAYSVAKAAMEALSKAIAMEFGPYGITVNLVAPGTVITDRMASRRSTEELEREAAATPLRHLGSTEEVAGAIVMFTFDEARFVTGQHIYVSGGTVMP